MEAEVNATDKTGVEMEALTAISLACNNLHMCKAIDKGMEIQDILIKKKGDRVIYKKRIVLKK